VAGVNAVASELTEFRRANPSNYPHVQVEVRSECDFIRPIEAKSWFYQARTRRENGLKPPHGIDRAWRMQLCVTK
jgi:hypothetical protein